MSLSDLPLRQSQLLKFVEPLLNDMPASAWKHALFEAFWSQRRDLLAIEDVFLKLVEYPGLGPGLASFFAGWWQVHDGLRVDAIPARCLESLAADSPSACGYREWAEASLGQGRPGAGAPPGAGQDRAPQLFQAMAGLACGNDRWLQRTHRVPAALEFRRWLEAGCLDGQLPGLQANLVRQVYVLGEARYLQPLLQRWLAGTQGWPAQLAPAAQAWCQLHAGSLQEARFQSALAAVDACTEAMAIAPDEPAARNLFAQYLQRRSRAMLACARVLPADSSPNPSGHPHE
ncbi:hypothetical protein [Pseudomonas sp. CMR5c]|uniref:hypothetical protein n=1 Tax=Pseudomonas sp. CMR5c TaxID=658630 RepID=UPI00069FB4BA|nr:hypothetical protein [Pseudomonas sp. CMR5c]AZC17616.1 hypothetical protein C4K40_2227 [Pseudomonas sp. CMR5c]